MKTKSSNINRGAAVFSLLFGLLFFLIFIRIVTIQVTGMVDGRELPLMADTKYSHTTVIDAERGPILDRNGIAIAQDMPAYTVIAILEESHSKGQKEPRHVVDVKETAEKLAPLLKMNESDLLKTLENGIDRDSFQVEFGSAGRGINYQVMQEIDSLHLPGIIFTKDTVRYYPNGNFATHVIGFARKNEQDLIEGKQGLEFSLDQYLREENGEITKKKDRNGIPIFSKDEEITPPKHGHTVYLTIDHKIQAFLEDAMNRVNLEYEPENIIGIVADPKTGAILAMSSRPSYDPNNIPLDAYMLNDAFASRFEPGSTMKIFTLATAIEEGVWDPNEKYQSGSFRVLDRRISDHNNGRGWGEITYLEGFQRSSNVAMANLVMNKMNGDDRLLRYLQAFGFGQQTGIDLPGEVNGKILYNWPIEKVTTSFGQGTVTTPIQQIQAATAIANGGKMMKPYIVQKIVDTNTNEVIEEKTPVVVSTPISESTASQVMDILETVVSSENGSGKPYRIEGYEIAGKTGTAQIPDPNANITKRAYLSGNGNHIYSFMGIAPKEDPKLLVYIAVKKPKLTIVQTGSQPVSAIFNSVVKNSLQYLKIKPISESGNNTEIISSTKEVGFKLPSLTGMEINLAVEKLEQLEVDLVVLGDGTKVESQSPYGSSEVIMGERVIIMTDGAYSMPDLTNWSLRDVMKLSELMDLKVNIIGYGYVKMQNIPPGSTLTKGDQLVLELGVAKPIEDKQQEIEQNDDFGATVTEEPLN